MHASKLAVSVNNSPYSWSTGPKLLAIHYMFGQLDHMQTIYMDNMLGQLDHSKILVCSHFQLPVTYNNSSYAWSMLQIYVKLITNFKLSNNQILHNIIKD